MSGTASRIRRVASTPPSAGHPHVHQDHVGAHQLRLAHGAVAVDGLGHDLQPVDRPDQRAQAATDDRVVVGEQDPHGHGAHDGRHPVPATRELLPLRAGTAREDARAAVTWERDP